MIDPPVIKFLWDDLNIEAVFFYTAEELF